MFDQVCAGRGRESCLCQEQEPKFPHARSGIVTRVNTTQAVLGFCFNLMGGQYQLL